MQAGFAFKGTRGEANDLAGAVQFEMSAINERLMADRTATVHLEPKVREELRARYKRLEKLRDDLR